MIIRSIAGFLFPIYASYKALKTSDPAQLTPWLMYWVVYGCGLLFESWTVWLLGWCVCLCLKLWSIDLPKAVTAIIIGHNR